MISRPILNVNLDIHIVNMTSLISCNSLMTKNTRRHFRVVSDSMGFTESQEQVHPIKK